MNNPNESVNEGLAERLWNQQGGHEEHATGDWLEAEYRAHSPIAPVQNEADLRMRGLGPLTHLPEPPTPAQPSESKTVSGPLLLAAGVCVAAGVLYSMLRSISDSQRE